MVLEVLKKLPKITLSTHGRIQDVNPDSLILDYKRLISNRRKRHFYQNRILN